MLKTEVIELALEHINNFSSWTLDIKYQIWFKSAKLGHVLFKLRSTAHGHRYRQTTDAPVKISYSHNGSGNLQALAAIVKQLLI